MNVAGILAEKGSDVETTLPGTLLIDVAQTLSSRRIGAIIIVDEKSKIAGIVSERDLVWNIALHGAKALHNTAGDVMTSPVITCSTQDTVSDLMAIMTDNRIRHLPVVEDEKLVGIISIGDVVKRRIAEAEFEAEEMKRYISSV